MAIDQTQIERLSNELHDAPVQVKWKIIEAVMRMALEQMHADTQIIRGEIQLNAPPETCWLLIATENKRLMAQLEPLLLAADIGRQWQ
jgi:hypothetical protein